MASPTVFAFMASPKVSLTKTLEIGAKTNAQYRVAVILY